MLRLAAIAAALNALGYRTRPTKWMLVQNPPSIPVFLVAALITFFRNTRLVIDWHNTAYSILGLRLGPSHPAVTLAAYYEGLFARTASAHFAVTHAMKRLLHAKWSIAASTLHDRPAAHFRPLTPAQRLDFLRTRPELRDDASFDLSTRSWRLLVSPTSWTADEDFGLFLDALALYASARQDNPTLPRIWAVITGKGPQQALYKARIHTMIAAGQLDE